MIEERELVQDLYTINQRKLFSRLGIGGEYDILSRPSTDRRVSREDSYNLMNGGSGIVYQQRQPKRAKTPEEAEMEIEHCKKYGPMYVGAVGGTTAGLSYALGGGATASSTLGLGLAGAGIGALALGGLIGLGAYYLFFRGRRKYIDGKPNPKYPLVRKRSVLYALWDALEKLWKEGSQKRQAIE